MEKKFKVTAIFTDYVYAEDKAQAIEEFDELMEMDCVPIADEIIVEELPPNT